MRIYLNNNWYFSEKFDWEMTKSDYDEKDMKEVRLPHTCKELPFHYFDEHLYQMVSGYRKKIDAPAEWEGKCVILTLDGVAHESEVFLNGEKIGEHHCGYTAFSMDISKKLHYGEENILCVKADSRESINVPPFGHVIDYMTYGGIYRDVYLEVKNPCYLEDVFLYSKLTELKEVSGTAPDENGAEGESAAEGRSAADGGSTADVRSAAPGKIRKARAQLYSQIVVNEPEEGLFICQYLRKKGTEEYMLLGRQPMVDAGEYGSAKEAGQENRQKDNTELTLSFQAEEAELWDIDNPALYEVKTQLLKGDKILDETVTVFGFRKAEFLKDGFYLNGRKVRVRGLNRHQSYPYVGYAMPKSIQRMDADVLKIELGLNAVRTSHYPQSHYFIDRCDELGLMVFTEIPGWQHIGDKAWKDQAVENTEDMIRQYRNHPSIILWGVRINESADDDAFYERTNAAARKLDPARQTGGVRAHKKSSLLEDVYTYNDFCHDGGKKGCEPKKKVTSRPEKPYMVTEYNGHMYPTKAFDCEDHRVEHALRHARVLNSVAGQEDIAGSFGWCMADYNTHKDFGSGDRICYHGVLDMFRNPKMAADIYSSQQEETPVLSVSSSMDIGEHPGGNRGKNWIFTNADSVRMYKNDRFIKEYKKEDSPFKNLKHGPILIDDYIGDAIIKNERFKEKQAKELTEALNLVAIHSITHMPVKALLTAAKLMLFHQLKYSEMTALFTRYIGDWGAASTVYRFEAVKNGKVVKTISKEPMKKMQLKAEADHTALLEGHTYDVAAVRIRMEDERGNLLNFYHEPVVLRVEGPVELIGNSVISLKGGMGGTYIKTLGKPGKAVLTLESGQSESVRIEFEVNLYDQTGK